MTQIDYDLVQASGSSLDEALESVRKSVGEHQTGGWQCWGSLQIVPIAQDNVSAPYLYAVVQPMVKYETEEA